MAAEELKGNFAAATEAAAGALAQARAGGDAAGLAEAALWVGIAAVQRGQPETAGACAAEALAARPGHPAALALAELAAATTHALPEGAALRSSSRGISLPDDPLALRLSVPSILPDLRRRVEDLQSATPELRARHLEQVTGLLAPLSETLPFVQVATADLLRRAGEPVGARKQLDAAAAAYEAMGDAAGEALCDLIRGDWAMVREGTPETLGLALSESPSTCTSELHGRLARYGAPLGDPAEAAAAYDRAQAGFGSAGAPRGVAAVALRRAAAASLAGEAPEALVAARDAQAAFDRAGDGPRALLASVHAALAEVQAGDVGEGTAVPEAIATWHAGGGARGWAIGLGMLFSQAGWGWTHRDQDMERALACHRLAARTFAGLGAGEFGQQTLADRAVAHRAMGDWTTALVEARDAWRAVEELTSAHPEQDAYSTRRVDLAGLLRGLAYVARDRDALAQLRPAAEAGLAMFEAFAAMPAHPGLDPEQAAAGIAGAKRAAAVARRDLEWDAAYVHLLRAHALRRASPLDFEECSQAALAAAASAPPERRGMLEALVHFELGDVPAALQAFEASPPPPAAGDADALGEQASLLVQLGAWPAARERHEALAALRGDDWWRRDSRPWLTLGELARVAEGLGEVDRSLDLYAQALEQLDGRRASLQRPADREALGTTRAEASLYGHAARAALGAAENGDAGRRALALEYAERGRARAMLERLAGSAALAPAPADEAAELRAWRELAARVSVLTELVARGNEPARETLEQSSRALEALERSLPARWLETVRPPTSILSAEQIAAALPEDSILIEHVVARGAVLGWALTREGIVAARSTPADDLEVDDLVHDLWGACTSAHGAWEPHAERLGELLLGPFADAIDASRSVILVPHGRARTAPLQVLRWRGAPLIEARNVSVLPSASALRFVSAHAGGAGGPLLAVGDPTDMRRQRPGEARASRGFSALPWAGAQAAEVAAWFDTEPLLGPAASEGGVRAALPGRRLLHFGTHGLLDDAPLLSCIVLADGGTLDVWELLGLDLDADLLTLNACDTARAPVTPGDEVTGLGWLALAAGARAVLASLWPVNEVSTALLMRAVYRELRRGRPAREALALAQRHVRRLTRQDVLGELAELQDAAAAGRPRPELPRNLPADLSHPFHWGGFVLLGC